MVIETRTRTAATGAMKPLPVSEIAVLNEANSCVSDRPLETEPLSAEPSFAFWQKDIPEAYWSLDGAALAERIRIAREKLGTRCVVLGHHYQREDIIQFTDYRGDSLTCPLGGGEKADAEYIVFAALHFMAESADILSAPHRRDPTTCRRALDGDMGTRRVYACWDELREAGIGGSCGDVHELGGGVEGVLRQERRHRLHVIEPPKVTTGPRSRTKVLFFPDQHLGPNTG